MTVFNFSKVVLQTHDDETDLVYRADIVGGVIAEQHTNNITCIRVTSVV